MTTNQFFGLFSCIAMMTFLAACGDDSGSNSNTAESGMESCTVTKNADSTSYVLKCPDGTEVEIHDGKNGEKSKNGVSDTSAAAGAGCTVKELEGGSVSLECPDGTKLVFGEDGKIAGKGSSSSATGTSSNSGGGSSSSAKPSGSSSSSQAATGKTQGYVQFNRDVYTTFAGAGIYLYDADNKANSASVTVYSDTPDTLLLNLGRQEGYFYGNLPITVLPGLDNSLFINKDSKLVVKYGDASTGVDKYDSAGMNLPDSLVSKPQISLSFGKSDYYDTTDKAIILLNDSRLTEGVSVTVHVRSDVDVGREISMYPVNGGDGSERVGFVGFSVDEPGAGYVKVEGGKSFGVSYGGISASATWRMSEYFGLNCTEDGKLQKGIKDTSKTYVCDGGAIRMAEVIEVILGKGCTVYNLNEEKGDYACLLVGSWKFNPTRVQKDSFTDSRDGQTYKTVKIGSQTWMAENLNYNDADRLCYNRVASNCDQYGGLYAYISCPSGWHLPSEAEFEELIGAVGGRTIAAKMLMSAEGWSGSNSGEDVYGFSALPAGSATRSPMEYPYNGEIGFSDLGSRALFTGANGSSASINNKGEVGAGTRAPGSSTFVDYGSVRCLKD